jgi:MFS transporter, PAT family, beta-lactamase induction signal transducer AmpG
MPRRDKTKPFVFFFLVLPYGISSGFVSITLPFVLTRSGFSVATGVSIVAIGVSANLWGFFWGPIADLTLTARGWYLIGLSAAALKSRRLGLHERRNS